MRSRSVDKTFLLGIIYLVVFSVIMLRSLAPDLFPSYFIYIAVGFLSFFLFSKIDFDIISLFSKHLYYFSIVFLILPLIIGQVTRGTVRWIDIGGLHLQPAEIVRPFLLVFFAVFLTEKEVTVKRLVQAFLYLLIPSFLILVQPSLGVSILTAVAFFGVLLASGVNKKRIALAVGVAIAALPLFWFLLAPYQKIRITSFLNPASDPYGEGYNSIQSMISVGSGKIVGRGLGKGVQTQLAFLPERHTDFIFASVSEELGLVGSVFLLSGVFFILWKLTFYMENSESPGVRAFVAGVFLTLFTQTLVNVGMNLGILPITGLPLPLVSAGGSSFLATMTALGICQTAKKLD